MKTHGQWCPGLRAGGVSRIRGTVRHERGSRSVPGREVSSIHWHLVAGRGHDHRTGVSVQRAVDANANATSTNAALANAVALPRVGYRDGRNRFADCGCFGFS